jgi:type III secretion protein N (ATPase)
MDSITRFARAQREIGLAAGEPPTRRGFPPSLFAALPRLLERSGPARHGSITGIYTILVEGDGTLDPVAEEVQAILDGHVILSRDLAQKNQFPAVDVLGSRSRLMDAIVSPQHREDAGRIRGMISRYNEVELLVRVGEYERGTDKEADEAIAKIGRINAFLRQAMEERDTFATIERRMREIVGLHARRSTACWSCAAAARRRRSKPSLCARAPIAAPGIRPRRRRARPASTPPPPKTASTR